MCGTDGRTDTHTHTGWAWDRKGNRSRIQSAWDPVSSVSLCDRKLIELTLPQYRRYNGSMFRLFLICIEVLDNTQGDKHLLGGCPVRNAQSEVGQSWPLPEAAASPPAIKISVNNQ